jgi:hypothetical protein
MLLKVEAIIKLHPIQSSIVTPQLLFFVLSETTLQSSRPCCSTPPHSRDHAIWTSCDGMDDVPPSTTDHAVFPAQWPESVPSRHFVLRAPNFITLVDRE